MCLQDGFDVLVAIPLSYPYNFVQDVHAPVGVDHADENHFSHSDREMVKVNLKIGWQHSQASGAAELRRCFETQGLMGVGFIDGSQHMAQFSSYRSSVLEGLTQEEGLKPTVEILH